MQQPPKWLEIGYIALFALLPWSVDWDFGLGQITLPSELLIGGLGLGLVGVFWRQRKAVWRLFSQRVFLQLSLAYLSWMLLTACFSSLSEVSWKYCLVAMAHWWVFALGFSVWPMLWRRAFPWFAFSMMGVAVYTLAHHAFYHFRADQAILTPAPFFPDHTMWAAAVAMTLPFLLGLPRLHAGWFLLDLLRWETARQKMALFRPLFGYFFVRSSTTNSKISLNQSKKVSFLCSSAPIATSLLLGTALVLSTCRAAWVSVLATGLWWAFAAAGARVRWAMLLGGGLFCVLFGGKLAQSLSHDASSMERLNRWSCAVRMAQDRPVFGFGPGTFQFQYLDYQREEEMTRISVREAYDHGLPHPKGRGGGVHSEYLRVLAEQGWPGFLGWLALVIWAVWKGFVALRRDFRHPAAIASALALSTFWVHGLANDFLHDSRMAALVWGGLALLSVSRKEDGAALGNSGCLEYLCPPFSKKGYFFI